jgi:hypothetical protein
VSKTGNIIPFALPGSWIIFLIGHELRLCIGEENFQDDALGMTSLGSCTGVVLNIWVTIWSFLIVLVLHNKERLDPFDS